MSPCRQAVKHANYHTTEAAMAKYAHGKMTANPLVIKDIQGYRQYKRASESLTVIRYFSFQRASPMIFLQMEFHLLLNLRPLLREPLSM